MSIIQFLRIVWARRWVVLAATVSCLIGALIVVAVMPQRWEAHSRILLELVKPDPVTGQIIQSNSTRSYVATQVELIKDYSVAGQVVDDLGLLSDPQLIRQYQRRPKSDDRDFRRWVSQRIIDGTNAKLVEGSNILEISFVGTSPAQSRAIADAIRKAYIDASRAFRVEQAVKNAEWYEARTREAGDQLQAAEKIKADYERQNGVILDDQVDIDTARLQALNSQSAAPTPMVVPPSISPARSELAQVDAAIARESQVLGPNHPDLQVLRNRRVALNQQVLSDQAASQNTQRQAARAAYAGVGALNSAVAAQRARVLGQRDKIERLRQLHSDVVLRRDLYTKTAERAAEFRHEAAAPTTGITTLGNAVTPQSALFPNMPLIIIGSLVFGMGTGVLVGLLMEMFGRRVRGPEDLLAIIDAPLIAVVTAPRALQGKPRLSASPPRAVLTGPRPVDTPNAAAA
jgi:polysaccharide biosynthesis transport protein